MFQRIIVSAVIAFQVVFVAQWASAKPRKPKVCAEYRIIVDAKDQSKVAICFDANKPQVWSWWREVYVLDGGEGPEVSYLVGFP